MDKSNYICVGPAQDLFCDLELYADDKNIEIWLRLFKKIVLKKWIIPKDGLALAWSGHTFGAPSDYKCDSYIGFILYNGDFLKLPMMQLSDSKFADQKYQPGIKMLYRKIIEQVIAIPAIGIRGSSKMGIDVRSSKYNFEIDNAKDYKKRLRKIYDETMQPGDTPEDVYARMKENNIQGKLLDMLQNDGFLYNRKYTWDKVYKKE